MAFVDSRPTFYVVFDIYGQISGGVVELRCAQTCVLTKSEVTAQR